MKDKEFESFIDKDGFEKLRVRMKIDNGKLIYVVFQYESFIDNRWHTIVRYDCAHGFFHRDTIKPNGDKEKQIIEIPNLKDAAKYAEQDLKDRWEWYKDKYIKRFKKK